MGLICGPTGVGKSDLACRVALQNGFEIISADSRQIYKGMEIGTGAVSAADRARVPHHLMGIRSPRLPYSVGEFYRDVMELENRHPEKKYLVVGGTPLYIKSLLRGGPGEPRPIPEKIKSEVRRILSEKDGMSAHNRLAAWDPDVAAKLHPHDRYRITKALENYLVTGRSYLEFDFSSEVAEHFHHIPCVMLTMPRAQLYDNINRRVENFFQRGWVGEVEALLSSALPEELPALNALGFREISAFLTGKMPEFGQNELISLIQKKSRNYAKKQITFFKNHLKEVKSLEIGVFKDFFFGNRPKLGNF